MIVSLWCIISTIIIKIKLCYEDITDTKSIKFSLIEYKYIKNYCQQNRHGVTKVGCAISFTEYKLNTKKIKTNLD